MNNLGTLYRYELKKIAKRKLLWITLFICALGIAASVVSGLLGAYYVDGEKVDTIYHMYQVDQAYRRQLSGRVIGQELLQEMADGYGRIPLEADRYTLTEEYQTYARPYSDIFNIVRSWANLSTPQAMEWDPDEDALYAARARELESHWQSLQLSDREKTFWREKEKEIAIPLTYYYHEGYEISLDILLTTGVLMLLFVAACLSGVFAEEHARRTDQLVLSSRNGRRTVYWAKVLAGVTICVSCSLLMAALAVGLSLGFYGAEGFQTAMQIFYDQYSYPMTIGQACLIAYGVVILTSVLAGVFVMVLSELLRSNIATLAVSTGLIIAGGMIVIPEEYRIVSQIWDSLPMTFLATWNVFNVRPITLLGHCFVSWQFVPICYLLCALLLALMGKRVYQRYQVSGR